MSMNSFGHLFRVTTWGESHGPALGATVDGCPPGVPLEADMLQHWLDKRRPGKTKFETQRREPDAVACAPVRPCCQGRTRPICETRFGRLGCSHWYNKQKHQTRR